MIRWFFVAILLFFAILFIMRNQGMETLSIDYVFGKTGEINPLIALFGSFVAGFFTWFVISLFNFLKMRAEISSREKLIRNLKQELNDYRNASLTLPETMEKTMIVRQTTAPEKGESF